MYKVIIQTKDEVIQTKSPMHNTINNVSIAEQNQSLIKNTYNGIIIQKYKGRIHIYKNFNNQIKQLISKLKTKAILIINPNQQIQKYLQQRKTQIQNLDYLSQQVNVDNQHVIGRKDFLLVVFRSLALSQQLQTICNYNNTYNCLALHIQSVTIVRTDTVIDDQLWKKLLQDNLQNKQIWLEIPNCLRCLSMLQPQVTGITINNNTQIPIKSICKVCQVRQKQFPKCTSCSSIQDNWVCMICGIIGCGRYKNADAFKHYRSSNHMLTIDLKTNYIWNYKFDCFSHCVTGRQDTIPKLTSSESDLQLYNDDIEIQFWKYCNVISEQLEKQKHFYEQIRQQQIQRYQNQQKQLNCKINQLEKDRDQKKQLLKKKIKKNKKIFKKFYQLQELCNQGKDINKNLQESKKVKNQSFFEKQIQNKKQQLKKLQSQIQIIYQKICSS